MSANNKSKATGILNEFRKFISKGNVLDLAVGVIVGGAFTSIVSSLVDDMIMPVIGMILAGINFRDLGITIPWGNEPFINIGSFIQAVITFLLTAFCVFVLVKFLNVFHQKTEKIKEEPKPSNEELLLTEIRDLLKQQNSITDLNKSDNHNIK